MTDILGAPQATAAQLLELWKVSGHVAKLPPSYTIEEIIDYYLTEGADQGVAGDLAFCQALHETGWFQFGGQVSPDQCNYSGLGATNDGAAGASFPTPQMGVRAQIQHLFAYAKGGTTRWPIIDPRYSYVPAGSVKTWEGLNGHWAVPGVGYGESIVALRAHALGEPVETWMPGATIERGPYDGGSHGGPVTAHDGLVEHVTTNWADPSGFFSRPVNGASSHFWIRKDGLIVQMLPLEVASWAQSAGNYSYVSVETDGTPDVELTPEQVSAFGEVYGFVETHPTFGGFGYHLAEAPGQLGLGWHGMGGAAWGGHTGCPGDLRKAQRPAILAAAQGTTISTGTGSVTDMLELIMALAVSDPGACVRLLYRSLLKRNVDPGGYTHFVTALQGGAKLEAVVQALTDSPEGETVKDAERKLLGLPAAP
jgi:hypothetical protein